MTSTLLPRRRFVGYLLSGFTSVGSLSGCGGGGSQASAGGEASRPTLISFVEHHSLSETAKVSALDQDLTGVKPAPDRFDADNNCHAFSAGSSAVATCPAGLGGGDFAVSFWVSTVVTRSMRALTLTEGSKITLAIDINAGASISVYSELSDMPLLKAGNSGDLADAAWHLILVQRRGKLIQLFVDGAAHSDTVPTLLGLQFNTILVGGSAREPLHACVDDVRVHNQAFGADDVMRMVYSWSQVKPSNHADAVAGYFPFDGDATNSTGKGRNGRLMNVQPTADRFDNARSAFLFNGVDAYIELQGSFDCPADDYAIAFWVCSSSAARMTALSISPGARNIAFVFNGSAGLQLVIDSTAEVPIAIGTSGEFTDGRWHFVLLQRTTGRLELHVDAVLRGTTALVVNPHGPGSVVRIGRSSDLVDQGTIFWAGSIDDVQIHERAFTPTEINDLQALQFRPRDGAGALTFAGRMWLLGGWNADDAQPTNSEVWSSTDGSNWSFVTHAPWEGRHTAGCLVFDGRLWIIGGDRNRGHYQNDVWSSADGKHWDFVTDQVPWTDRATHYTLAFNGRMWLMGGQQVFSESGQVVAYNDVYSSTDGRHWRLETAQAPWSPRGLILGSVVFGGRMWIIGGGTYDVRTYQNDVWSSADGVHWDRVTERAPWSGRQYHSVTVFDNKIWVVAGCAGDSTSGTDDVWCSANGSNWTRVAGTPWKARHAASVVAHRNALWVVAGSSTAVYNDVWKLSYAS